MSFFLCNLKLPILNTLHLQQNGLNKETKCLKLFFDVVTPRQRKFQMGALKRDDDTLSTNPDEMREIAPPYY